MVGRKLLSPRNIAQIWSYLILFHVIVHHPILCYLCASILFRHARLLLAKKRAFFAIYNEVYPLYAILCTKASYFMYMHFSVILFNVQKNVRYVHFMYILMGENGKTVKNSFLWDYIEKSSYFMYISSYFAFNLVF